MTPSMETAPAELFLRANGVQAVFGIEFAFDSERVNEGCCGQRSHWALDAAGAGR